MKTCASFVMHTQAWT